MMRKPTAKLVREKRLRVFAADGDSAVRDHLTRFSETFPASEIVGYSESAEETLEKLRVGAVDLLVIEMDHVGVELITNVKVLQPDIKILVTSKLEQSQKESLLSGANGFILKPFSFGELGAAVATVLDGNLYYTAGLLQDLNPPTASPGQHSLKLPNSLTEEDKAYVHARLAGKADKQIAKDLKVKMETISQRRYRIAQRLGLETDIETFLLRATQWQMPQR